MILGLSGKLQSGKNTIANIIQYLIAYHNAGYNHPISENDYNSYIKNNHHLNSNWIQKCFANKLKDIVCLLIGCTKEQLESQEFKSSPLGKEWERWYYSFYKMKTNENNGRVSPYFDTKEECENYEFPKLFGKPIYNKEQLYLESEILTPRLIMQLVGTNLFRNQLHPSIWVNGLFADYKRPSYIEKRYYNEKEKIGFSGTEEVWGEFPNWIITDVRFPNEVEAIKKKKWY